MSTVRIVASNRPREDHKGCGGRQAERDPSFGALHRSRAETGDSVTSSDRTCEVLVEAFAESVAALAMQAVHVERRLTLPTMADAPRDRALRPTK